MDIHRYEKMYIFYIYLMQWMLYTSIFEIPGSSIMDNDMK